MAKLEDLTRAAAVKGILPDPFVSVIDVKWCGSAAVELTHKDDSGKHSVVYRDREHGVEIGEMGRPSNLVAMGRYLGWSPKRIGSSWPTSSNRFEPPVAIHKSVVKPLPHQITPACGEIMPRQPLRFLLSDDPHAVRTFIAALMAQREDSQE